MRNPFSDYAIGVRHEIKFNYFDRRIGKKSGKEKD